MIHISRGHRYSLIITIWAIMLAMLVLPMLPANRTAMAADEPRPVSVLVDSRLLQLDVAPILENDRLLVPVRAISESLGATVDWNAQERKINLVKGNVNITLIIDDSRALYNGEGISLDVPPRIVDDRTLVPLRFVSEYLGAQVEWRPDSREVIITTSPGVVPDGSEPLDSDITPDDPQNQAQPGTEDLPDKIETPGTYGPSEGVKEVNGDMTVCADGVELQNVTIHGNLEVKGAAAAMTGDVGPAARAVSSVAAGSDHRPGGLPAIMGGVAASGKVSFNNVTVDGVVTVSNGSSGTIILNNFRCNSLLLNNRTAKVQIIARGDSDILKTELKSSGFLQELAMTGSKIGFTEVEINAVSADSVDLDGNFGKVICNNPGLIIDLKYGSIIELIVSKTAKGCMCNITHEALVSRCQVDAVTYLTGSGDINSLEVNAADTTMVGTLRVSTTFTGYGLTVNSSSVQTIWVQLSGPQGMPVS